MIASRPSTPVAAAASGIVPLYDVPVMPTLPVDHDVATTASLPSTVVKPFARPFSQSMTAFGASCSGASPTVGSPATARCRRSECTTAKPRGTHVADERGRHVRRASALNSIAGCDVRGGGGVADFLLHVPEELRGRRTCRRSTATTRRSPAPSALRCRSAADA